MKLKELHSLMQDIQPFTKPKVDLEQYPTGADLASRLLFTVSNMFDEFEGRTVIDLGCGTAMLSVGAAMLGSRHVLGVDIDPEALEVAAANIEQFTDDDEGRLPIDLMLCDVLRLGEPGEQPVPSSSGTDPSSSQREGCCFPHLVADTVIMNPPFGTKRQAGADMAFLRAALRMSRGSVYSLHKTSTRAHIQRAATREMGAQSAEVLAELRYELPATMKFHKQKAVDIQVDLWRFTVRQDPASGNG